MVSPFLQGMQAGSQLVGDVFEPYQRHIQNQMMQKKMDMQEQAAQAQMQNDRARQELINAQIRQINMKMQNPALFSSNPQIAGPAIAQHYREQGATMSPEEAHHISQHTGKNPLTGETVPVTKNPAQLYPEENNFRPSAMPEGEQVTPTPKPSAAFAPGAPGAALQRIQRVSGRGGFENSTRLNIPDLESKFLPKEDFKDSPDTISGQIERNLYQDRLQKAQALLTRKKYQASQAWSQTSPSSKSLALAYAASMKVDPLTASKFFGSGGTLQQMADQLGYNLNEVTPSYAPEARTRANIQTRQVSAASTAPIDEFVTNALAPYSRRWEGFSAKQIKNALGNLDPEEQGKYLAAQALSNESVINRLIAAGGRFGIGALQEIKDNTYGVMRNLPFTVSPEAYKIGQEYISDVISRSVAAAQAAESGMGGPQQMQYGQHAFSPKKQATQFTISDLQKMARGTK